MVAIVGFEIICLTGLRSTPAREWFDLPADARVTHSQWVWPLVFIGLASSTTSSISNFISTRSFEKLSNDVFSVNTELTFADAQTGLPVSSIGTSGAGFVLGQKSSFEPRFSYEHSNHDGFMTVGIRGVAWKPEDLTFTCRGYEDFVFTLNRDTKRKVRVEMKPLATPEDALKK